MAKKFTTTPTMHQFGSYQAAYDYLSEKLFAPAFGATLKPCILNLAPHGKAFGYFSPERWSRGKETSHEISLSPRYLNRAFEKIMSTLAHEMIHQYQYDTGTACRARYHDQHFAELMAQIGLVCSSTGKPGGPSTGQNMTQFIESGGVFEKSIRAMPEAIKLPWLTGEADKPVKKTVKKVRQKCNNIEFCEREIWITEMDEIAQVAEELDALECTCGGTFVNAKNLESKD